MSSEIQIDYGTASKTLYALVQRITDGKFWNTNTFAFEAFTAANYSKYVVAMSELGGAGASAMYTGNFPTSANIGNGTFFVRIRLQVGGSAAVTDTPVASQTMQWTGSAACALAGTVSPNTFNVAAGATFNNSNTNGSAVTITGNGTGAGLKVNGGTSADAVQLIGASGHYDLNLAGSGTINGTLTGIVATGASVLLSYHSFLYDPAGTIIGFNDTPDYGPAFATTSASAFVTQGDGTAKYTHTNDTDIAYFDSGNANVYVQSDINLGTSLASDTGLLVRGNGNPASTNTGFFFAVNPVDGNLDLVDMAAPTTVLASIALPWLAASTWYTLSGYTFGSTIQCTVSTPGHGSATLTYTSTKYQTNTVVAFGVGVITAAVGGVGGQLFRRWSACTTVKAPGASNNYIGSWYGSLPPVGTAVAQFASGFWQDTHNTNSAKLVSRDNFVEPVVTDIAAHSPDLGPAWSPQTIAIFFVQPNGTLTYPGGAGGDACMVGQSLGTGNHGAAVEFNFGGSVNDDISLIIRADTATPPLSFGGGYFATLNQLTSKLEWRKALGLTLVASSPTLTLNANAWYRLEATAQGSTLTAILRGTGMAPVTLSATDNLYQNNGFLGFAVGDVNGNASNKELLRNWSAYTLPASPSWTTGILPPPTAAQNATAIWTDPISGLDFSGTGSIGQLHLSALSHIGSGQILTTSLVQPGGSIGPIVIGDDYNAADGRGITWTDAANVWPTLTGATVTFYAYLNTTDLPSAPAFSKAVSVIVGTGSNKQVQMQLAATDTNLLQPGTYRIKVVAVLSSGRTDTLVYNAVMTVVNK